MECFANHRIKVQTRKIYEGKAILTAVAKYGKRYENLDHVLAEWKMDCFQRKFKLPSAIFYSKENAVMVLEWFLLGKKNVSGLLPSRDGASKSMVIEKGVRSFWLSLCLREKGSG